MGSLCVHVVSPGCVAEASSERYLQPFLEDAVLCDEEP
jgi:hypothetical protein